VPIIDPVLRIQESLTSRDHRILSWLYDHQVLTTDQIAHALFPSLDSAQTRLRHLTHLGAVARFRPQRPDGGSYSYRYVADQLGFDVVAAQRGDRPPRPATARERRRALTSTANLPHLLGTNQFFIDLAGHAYTHPEAALDRWWPGSRFHDKGAYFSTGSSPGLMLLAHAPRPDGHGIWTEHGASRAFFLEHDTGTEPLRTLVGKVLAYLQVEAHNHRPWPVLFWLPTARREHNFHLALADTLNGHLPQVPVATAARDHAANLALSPAEDVWWLYRHEGARLRLAELPATHDHDYLDR
jgi:hypothetical protein